MPFTEGNKETRGRKRGIPNKNSAGVKDNLQLLVESNMLTLDKDLRLLTPKDRVRAIIDLCRFIVPTLKAVEQDVKVSNDLTWLDQFSEQELEKLLNK
jgi:hypothetical protein